MRKLTVSVLLLSYSLLYGYTIDVYFYNVSDKSPFKSAIDVKNIVFNENNVTITYNNGNNESVPLANISNIRFYNTEETGINNAVSANDTKVIFNDNVLLICSSDNIDRIDIYTTSGQNIKTINKVTANIIVPINNLPSGIYVVKVTVADDVCIQKFIKQ